MHPSGTAIKNHNPILLATLYVSAFVAAFNENLVNTALVRIMDNLMVGADTAQWLVTGYMVVTATMVTLMGWAYNRFDTKRLLACALGIFAMGEFLGLLAPTFWLLLSARLVQAVGTGMLITLMMSSVLVLAPRERMGTYLSIGSCMITFGPAFAPVVSGAITTYMGWRWIFVPPLVVSAVLLVLCLLFGRNLGARQKTPVDALSVALSALALFALAYGLGQLTGQVYLGIACVVAGVVLGAFFAWRQLRLEHPLLDVRLLKSIHFWPACILTMVGMMTTFSMSVLLPLYFEGSLGTTAFIAGCLLLVPILVNAVAALAAGRVMDLHGAWPLLPVGFALILVGQAAAALTGAGSALWGVLIASVVAYTGVACTMTPSQTAGLQTLSQEQHPDGVALVNVFVQIAACIGPALFVGVLSSGAAAGVDGGLSAGAANALGFSRAVWMATAIALAGFVLSIPYSLAVRTHRGH